MFVIHLFFGLSCTVPFFILSFFFDVHRWVLLEALDKVSPGSVKWKQATKPPIKMPFRKVENCNQVVQIGKQLKFSLVNVAGNDFVQGNKKLIIGMNLLCSYLPSSSSSSPYFPSCYNHHKINFFQGEVYEF